MVVVGVFGVVGGFFFDVSAGHRVSFLGCFVPMRVGWNNNITLFIFRVAVGGCFGVVKKEAPPEVSGGASFFVWG